MDNATKKAFNAIEIGNLTAEQCGALAGAVMADSSVNRELVTALVRELTPQDACELLNLINVIVVEVHGEQ
jgi:hypothetical protein